MDTPRSWPLRLCAIFLAAGCTQNIAYRTDFSPCTVESAEQSAAKCGRHDLEVTNKYSLAFVEFDDQGWLYRPEQMDRLFEFLHEEARDDRSNLLVLVFVHGWRHNAEAADGNVESFRRTLAAMYDLDTGKGQAAKVRALEKGAAAVPPEKPRKVIGIYAGWRGKSLEGPDLWEILSFYDRRFTADHVAKGSMRELFARLRHFQRAFAAQDSKDPKVRMAILGHSFGGLVVYNALAEYLIESAISAPSKRGSTGQQDIAVKPFADMVMLINPAFEGSRYEPLHRVVSMRAYAPGQPPVFVAVTTDNDQATRYAFPIGRWINTVLEKEVDAKQKEANVNTVGHIERYRTHLLASCDDKDNAPGGETNCVCSDAWGPGESGISDEVVKAEEEKAAEFRAAWSGTDGKLRSGWTRYFCGGVKLTHLPNGENRDPDSAFWIVYTDQSIIDGHNGFDKPAFRFFVRQLFHDTWPR